MSLNLYFGTLRQRRVGLFWFAAGLVAYSWMMVWYWPLLGDEYLKLVETMPPELLAAFVGSEVDLGTLGGFFQGEYLGLMWIAIVSSAMIAYSSKAIAGEIAVGTMELLLAQPISRLRFVLTRAAGLVTYAAALAVASFAPIQLLGPSYDINLPVRTIALLYASGSLFMLAVGGFAFMLSAAMRDGSRPAAITGSLIGVMWVLQAISQLADFAKDLETVNLLKYWQPGVLINKGSVPDQTWWVYGGVAIVSLAVAVVVFMRRDLA